MLSASGVLDCRTDLLHRLTTDDVFRHITSQQFYADWYSNWYDDTRTGPGEVQRLTNNAKYLTDRVTSALPMAALYRVSAPMVDLLLHAAAQLDAEDTFDPGLAPTPHGFVHFTTPVPVHDLRDETMLGHWLLWCPVSVTTVTEGISSRVQTTLMVWWNDNELQPDVVQERMIEELASTNPEVSLDQMRVWVHQKVGRWSSIGSQYLESGAPIGELETPVNPDVVAFEMAKMMNAPAGEAAVNTASLATSTTNLARIVHALWLMMGQTVALTHDDPVERHAAKRATRAKLPAKVTVVKLRREREHTPGDGESEAREYHHHWIVNGHWRWQPYGPKRSQRRRQWIAPYVKGNLDAPLLGTEKLFDLSR